MDTTHAIAASAWLQHDSQLILACVLALATVVTLIAVLRIAPFFAILLGTFVAGAVAGLPMEKVAKAFSQGAGGLLGDVGVIIALGAMLGALMAESGAADRLVDAMLRRSTPRTLPWLMAGVAVIIGLPLFFEVGLVVMVPIIFVMARRANQPVLRIAIPALAGMTTLHALLPPHPGPLIAVSALHADLGMTILLGFIAAIPAIIIAGPLYGMWLGPRIAAQRARDGESDAAAVAIGATFDGEHAAVPVADADASRYRRPSFGMSLITILLPVILMLGRTIARLLLPAASPLTQALEFLGEPIITLSLTVIVAIVGFGWATGRGKNEVGNILRRSLPPICILLLTIGAGGGLKQTLVLAGISDTVSKVATGTHLPLVLLAYLIAICLRQATGSATVATTTTAGIVAPLAMGMPATHGALLTLSIGAGSVFFCHVNDAGFWMVREFFGLKLKETIWVWSLLQTLVSVVGITMVLVMWKILT
ncbi:gluconate:H+ symporter [Robbsia andropogonis]|uniref:GntT/GntP/DsdX family permease n=1 Tax=Robbsia andropogonis TaxID=28092 RepID=UPI0009E63645|nr:gluconate:H+ symporter [Robbsia andropogonis]